MASSCKDFIRSCLRLFRSFLSSYYRAMKTILMIFALSCHALHSSAGAAVKELRVFKSERRLELIGEDNQVIKTYKVMLGKNPIGHKQQEGDNKTPEGQYTLDEKNPDSSFHKSLHISYPNLKDKLKARARGVSPGGDIMLHGYPNNFSEMTEWLRAIGLESLGEDIIRASLSNFDWTSGCIAVTDDEIDEIYSLVSVPTKIIIRP